MISEQGSGAGAKIWGEEAVFHEGDEFFSALIAEISLAKRNVDLETYIFDKDPLGDALIAALKNAATRGVTVRLLLDGVGCSQWNLHDADLLEESGVQVRYFHPLPWQNRAYSFFRFIRLKKILMGIWKLNRRNHRKVCIIDERVVFAGGMNVSGRQLRSVNGAEALRDTSVRVAGGDPTPLLQAFNNSWYHFRSHLPSRKMRIARGAVRLNRSRTERHLHNSDLALRISRAQTKVWITTPYFVPDWPILVALRNAANRKIDVKLLVPRDNKVWGLKWAAKAFYGPMLSWGVGIFEYLPTLLHAKVVITDGEVTVGSSNFNHRSLFYDLEVDIQLFKPESILALEKRFKEDLLESDHLTAKIWKQRPKLVALYQFARQRLALLFKKWI